MRKILPILITALVLTGCNSAPGHTKNSYRQKTMNEAISMLKETSDYIILDVRTITEYKEKHIPGAINIPNETIASEEPVELTDKEQLIYVYCRSGNRSKQAAQKLADLGYTNIVEIGRIIDWPGETVSE